MNECKICSAGAIKIVDSYKHKVTVCEECGGVCHFKKSKYLLEKIFSRRLARAILPKKAFLRLFSDRGEFLPSDFYDSSSFNSTEDIGWRRSEVEQFKDQLNLINFDPRNKKVLDISGGPGNICAYLKSLGTEVFVTEYSQNEVSNMQRVHNIDARVFDYTQDKIEELFEGKFSLIMVRSSIIFCEDLEDFIAGLDKLLEVDGIIMIETILPSMGEILWWQQLEYKFPRIYSSNTIKTLFENCGYQSFLKYQEWGNYSGVKLRSYRSLARQLFTWLVDYPMVVAYKYKNRNLTLNIDKSLNHLMETSFWQKKSSSTPRQYDLKQGRMVKSKTFGYRYNGYLKDLK